MSSPFTFIRLFFLTVATAFAFFGAQAFAQSTIEKLVSPGELSQAHAQAGAQCVQCHATFKKSAQNALCLDCHKDVGADITGKKGFHGKSASVVAVLCKSCHTEHEGAAFDIAPIDTKTFDHALTDYPLSGGHRSAACADCHAGGRKFREAPSACFSCHEKADPHKGTFGKECQSCHVVADWKTLKFDHAKTAFPLLGKHKMTECAACHADQKFKGVSTSCVDCHQKDDAHKGTFGKDCADCHNADSWTGARFDHGARTGFSLLGQHASIACNACHTISLSEPKLESACVSCHRKDDKHKGRNGPACANCHDEASWRTVRFDHNLQTKFLLRGAHAKVACETCHIEPVTKKLPGVACIDCHRDDDPHKGSQGEKCGSCHTEASWTTSVRFDHDLSAFPLLGAHKQTPCASCHLTKEFKDAPLKCAECHEEDDVHKGSLGDECGLCHNPVSWAHWRFDHNTQTDFKLTGAHEGLKCVSCHRPQSSDAMRQSTSCISCHRADDKHRGQYGVSCERCHNTESFKEIRMPK